MKVLLSGYYGFDNAGDDAVLFAIVQALREKIQDVDITVLSRQPEKTAEEFHVKAVDRWSKGSILKAVKDCDVLISGGGSLLQDVTSKNGILYYLGIIKLAQMLRKKVIIYAQGIGPIREPRNRSMTAKILNKVQAITVRDFESRAELMQMGVYREIFVGVDPVMGITSDQVDETAGEKLLRQAASNYSAEKPVLIVSARNWQHSENYFQQIAKSCDAMAEQGWQIIFLPFHYPEDAEAGRAIALQMDREAIVMTDNYTPQQTMAILKNADMILGMRLHSLIMGAALLKPIVALSYDPKVDSFMQLLRQRDCFAVDSVDAEQLVKAMQNVMSRSEKQKQILEQHVEIMSRQAKAPADLLLDFTK